MLRLLGLPPALVRIERRHALDDGIGAWAEILLVDGARMADDEGAAAGIGLVGGPGDQRKPADHLALDDVAHRAARRARALLGEDAVVVAVIGLWFAAGLVT